MPVSGSGGRRTPIPAPPPASRSSSASTAGKRWSPASSKNWSHRARLVRHFTAGHEAYRDTRFVFVLEAVGEATRLRVTQLNEKGWPPALKEHAQTSWTRVMRSLKAWVETGEGDPISSD